jgi:hypothetical protein
MKPLLRAILIVDTLVTAAFGLLLVATPWASLYGALQLVQVSPAMVGQLFGVALLALAWLQLRAAINGALTAPVAAASGHALWISGVVMLIWLVAVRSPSLAGLGVWIGPLVGVALLLHGLINVRLASAVRRRERAAAQGSAAEVRAEKRAVQAAASTAGIGSPPATGPVRSATLASDTAPVRPNPTDPYERREPLVSSDDKPPARG